MAVAIVGMAGFAGIRWRQADRVARLPSPPAELAGQPRAVLDHLRKRYEAARRNPTSVSEIGSLCLAYHADMLFDHAERCYAVASSLDSGEWRWTYYRALIHTERGGGGALVGELRDVLGRAPQFAPAWLRLGDAEFKAGRYDAAAEAWQRAIELPPPQPDTGSPLHAVELPLDAYASLGLARIALQRGDAGRAREILERVTAESPTFSTAFRLLAESYLALGREADSARAVYRARRLPPYAPYADPQVDVLARESRNSTFLLRLASEANLSINGPWSEYLSRRAVEFDPDNPDAVVKLARVLRTIERNEEALELFIRYNTMVPGDFQGLAHIGSCLSALGRYSEAESYFRRALAGRDDPVTHYNLGLLMAIGNRLDEAVAEYQKALDGDPMNSDARGNLAAVLVRQGKLERASRELVRLVELDPENARARTNLGLVLLQQNQTGRARQELEEALRLDPTLTPAREAIDSLGIR